MANPKPVRLLVIVSEDSSYRMELTTGVPDTVEELIEQVKHSCGLCGGIRLQYKDEDFGMFVNLSSTSAIKDLTTIKVIQLNLDAAIVLQLVDVSNDNLPADLSSSGHANTSHSERSDSDDTVLLSSSSSEGFRTEPWPKVFPIPIFSYDTEGQLEKGNAEYTKSKERLTPSSKMLSDILEKLAEKIYSYKAYPNDADLSEVAEALTRKHPCLRQPDSFNESYGWKLRLKQKMSNYRTQLKSHGLASEVMVNSLKHKSPEDPYPAKNIKKARRGEANHYPSHPSSETPESLEQDRTSLLTEIKKRNNEKMIREKMAKTFGYRRQEVVDQKPSIEDIMARWPALFQMEEVYHLSFIQMSS